MAKTYGYALMGALLATFTVAPMLSSLLRPETVRERETIVVQTLTKAYAFLLRQALRHRRLTVGVALALLAFTGAGVARLGTEFLPKLKKATSGCGRSCRRRFR